MSWSIGILKGHPEALKPLVSKQMDNAIEQVKSVPHEHSQAKLAKQMIMDSLDFLSKNDNPAVEVEAGGSACAASSGYVGNSQITVKVTPIFSFISK